MRFSGFLSLHGYYYKLCPFVELGVLQQIGYAGMYANMAQVYTISPYQASVEVDTQNTYCGGILYYAVKMEVANG